MNREVGNGRDLGILTDADVSLRRSVEWLLVDTPDPVQEGVHRAALIHTPHIAFVRWTMQGLTLFLRHNRMIVTLVDPATTVLVRSLLEQGRGHTLLAATTTREWYPVGSLLVNCAELTWIEFDVPLATHTLPSKARITTTYHGETSGIASDMEAGAWWAFARARGTTVAQIVADAATEASVPDASTVSSPHASYL